MSMSNLDVVVAVCSGETWKAPFGLSLVKMVADFSQKYDGFDSQRIRVNVKYGSMLFNMREELAKKALELDATHLLFVDTDQTFPPDTLRRLVQWKEPIVACNIATKQFPTQPTARLFDKKNPYGKLLLTWKDSIGLVPVWRVGTGIMLIETRVFRKVTKPWFPVVWKEEIQKYQGEDWGFCEKAEAFGFHAMVDQGLSWEVGHVGQQEFKHDLVLDPADWGEKRPDGTIETELLVPTMGVVQ